MEEEYLKVLIKKYVDGTANPAEREELLSWYYSQTDEGYLWPYENIEEEVSAKRYMLNNLQQRIVIGRVKRPVLTSFYLKIAAAVLLVTSSLFIFYRIRYSVPNIVAFNTVSTKVGEHRIIKLSDGSTIWLSAKSQVRYPIVFNRATREITFEGEAFFDVAKDKKHPFIVHTGKTSTLVLGTTFNIRALHNKPDITVALLTGKVAFSDGKSELKLFPGYQIIYNKNTNTAKLQNIPNMADVISRRDGDYEYKSVSVADVIADVNLNFNVNFKVEGKVKICPFFGRMKPGESPVAFLKKLAIVVNAEVIQTDSGYIIKGGGCD